MAIKFIHFEEILSHMHKRKVFLLRYLSYDVVLSRRVLQLENSAYILSYLTASVDLTEDNRRRKTNDPVYGS